MGSTRVSIKCACLLWVLAASSVHCYVISSDPNQVQSNSIQISPSAKSQKGAKNLATLNEAQNNSSNAEEASQAELEHYWLNQRELFFNQTTFNLTKVSEPPYICYKKLLSARMLTRVNSLSRRKRMILWAKSTAIVAIICLSGLTTKCSRILPTAPMLTPTQP